MIGIVKMKKFVKEIEQIGDELKMEVRVNEFPVRDFLFPLYPTHIFSVSSQLMRSVGKSVVVEDEKYNIYI